MRESHVRHVVVGFVDGCEMFGYFFDEGYEDEAVLRSATWINRIVRDSSYPMNWSETTPFSTIPIVVSRDD